MGISWVVGSCWGPFRLQLKKNVGYIYIYIYTVSHSFGGKLQEGWRVWQLRCGFYIFYMLIGLQNQMPLELSHSLSNPIASHSFCLKQSWLKIEEIQTFVFLKLLSSIEFQPLPIISQSLLTIRCISTST